MCALGFVCTYMERKILHQKIQMPAYWWLCTRQIVLGAQLAAIYVDVHSGIKSEKNIATYHEVFFKGACEFIIFFFF